MLVRLAGFTSVPGQGFAECFVKVVWADEIETEIFDRCLGAIAIAIAIANANANAKCKC